jgi:large subunit ribosomal protein L7A
LTRNWLGAKLIKRVFWLAQEGLELEFDPTMSRDARKRFRQSRVVGAKAVQRALTSGIVEKVFVAKNADERVVRGVLELCKKQGIPVVYSGTTEELGKSCGLRVGAAAYAVLKSLETDQ